MKKSEPRRHANACPLSEALFARASLQRLLGALAWHGAMFRLDAFRAARYSARTLKTLSRSGHIVCWYEKVGSRGRSACIALNDGHPAMKEFRALLKAIVPKRDVSIGEFDRPRRTPVRRALSKSKIDLTLHSPGRTIFLALLEAMGGSVDHASFVRGMFEYAPPYPRQLMRGFVQQGILREDDSTGPFAVAFNSQWRGATELRSLCRKILKLVPPYRVRVTRARALPPAETYKGHPHGIPYFRGTEGAVRPRGMAPSETFAPLLFGTDARYRILAVLALHGPTRIGDLLRAAHVDRNTTIQGLERDGLVRTWGRVPLRIAALDLTFPAHAELLNLLRAMHKAYPVIEKPQKQMVITIRNTRAWNGEIENFCCSVIRAKVLISVGLCDGIDTVSLTRLFPEHTRTCLRLAAHMFTAFGVFERVTEGNARPYRLNPKFCAFHELRLFVRKLANLRPQYARRGELQERYMSPMRLTMRRNARKKRASSGGLGPAAF